MMILMNFFSEFLSLFSKSLFLVKVLTLNLNFRLQKKMIKTDVLVIGSGISGLSYAIKISEQLPDAKITIVTKAEEDETNTKYAQGGLAVVMDFDTDNFQKHIDDTMRAGDYENNREVVEMVIKKDQTVSVRL
jgi:aspartate oxidase